MSHQSCAAANTRYKNKTQVEWGIDLATEHERFLAEETFKHPVIVYNYPKVNCRDMMDHALLLTAQLSVGGSLVPPGCHLSALQIIVLVSVQVCNLKDA